MLRKRAIRKVQPSPDQILSSIFVIPKEDIGHRPVINFKKLLNRQTYTVQALQNGRSVTFEGGSAESGLHAQNWSHGCLSFSALASGISNICKVSIEGSVVSVSMSMLWSVPSTKDIYKTVEDSDRSFEEADDATNNISRRYFNYGRLYRGTDIGSRQSNIPTWRFGFCDKPFVIKIKKSVL